MGSVLPQQSCRDPNLTVVFEMVVLGSEEVIVQTVGEIDIKISMILSLPPLN